MNLDDIRPYLTDPAWFTREPYGLHGVAHVTRVSIWAAVLAHRVGRPDALGYRDLMWAAACHDVGRLDDGIDEGHGRRSASWVGQHLVEERRDAAAADLRHVQQLCVWHQVADPEIGRWSLELMLLKDADGLDRARLHDLDPERLRTQAARRLVEDAGRLFEETDGMRSPGEIVSTAIRLGIG